MTTMERPRKALLLSGGNARGPVAQLTLERLPDDFDVVLGVSVGSIEAAPKALGLLPVLRDTWMRVDGKRFYMKPNVAHWREGLYTLRPLAEVYREIVEPHWDRLRTLRVGCGVYDLASDRYRTIWVGDCESFDVWLDAVLASCSMHPIMRWYPIRVRGVEHPAVDGGVVHVVPLLPDWEDFDEVVAVLHSPVDRKTPKLPEDVDKIVETTGRIIERAIDNVVREDVRRLRYYAERGKAVTLYSPIRWPGESFDASAETMRWRLEVVGEEVWANGVAL